MSSGIKDGDFDRLLISRDLAVGQDAEFGTSGQVLTSDGEGNELFWGTNSATLPQNLVKGSNITFTTSAGSVTTFNGSVETTISATDTDTGITTLNGGSGITITDVSATEKTITADIDNDTIGFTTAPKEIKVNKVPNSLTAGTNITFTETATPTNTETTFNGSKALTITATDTNTEYQGGVGISIDTTTSPKDTINCSNIPNSALANSTISGKALGTSLGKLTCGVGGNNSLKLVSIGGSTTGEYDGSADKTLEVVRVPFTLTSDNITTKIGGSLTGGYDGSTQNKSVSVVRVPEVLKAGDHIRMLNSTFNNTDFDGSTDITISVKDEDFITKVFASDGIITTTGGTENNEKTIKTHIDADTIVFSTGSPTKLMKVAKVPNKLKAGSGISMSADYDGSAEITISATDTNTTETIVVQVNPTTDTSYAVYRRQLTDPRSLTEQFYIIDTGFKYQFTSPPVARYYKVEIQFVLSNSAINLPALAIEPVYLRLDKDDDGDNAWGIPQLVDIAYATGGTLQVKQASFILDFGSSFATLSVPEYPQIFPSMIQSSGAVSPSAGRRATNENAIVVYGGSFFPQGLKMVLTPMGTDITTTTTGNPFSITGSDGISFVSNNIVQNPYISIATRVQEAQKIFSAGTSYTEYSSDFRVSFVATSSNILVEFRAIVRADQKIIYGALYDYNSSEFFGNTRNRFNFNDETDQDFTTITWMLKGLTKGTTYYVSPYFRSNTGTIIIYAGHNNSTDGFATAIMRIFDGGNDVSYVEPSTTDEDY